MKSFLRLTIKKTALPALVLFVLLTMSDLASSQHEYPDKPNYYMLSFTMYLVVMVVIPFAIFSLWVHYCCTQADNGSVHAPSVGARRMTNATVARGLDTSMIETFPTFIYSEVKTQNTGNGALECAICLNEFQDDETLRLLPICDHVFHPHCIGAWLQCHVTCPVCRMNLADQQQTAEPVEPEVITETDIESQQPVIPESAVESVARVKLSRSHTTGHSVISPGECTERFTLRLRDDLRKKLIAIGKMNRSNSLSVLPRINRSNSLLNLPRSGKPLDRSMARWDLWLFLKTPSSMWRSRDNGSIRPSGSCSI